MDDYSLRCPICIETFKSPRQIKKCGHSFCEQCLFTYVTTLEVNWELGSTFPCPVCRQKVTTPSDTDVTLSWIQTFPVDEKLTKILSSVQTGVTNGNESTVILCDPCIAVDDRDRAVQYCVNCQEYLCKNCVGVHRKYKIFHGHRLSDISQKMLTLKLKELVSMTCEKHPDRVVDVYCQEENIYCCLICATVNHRECAIIKEIVEMEGFANKKVIDFYKKFELSEKHIDKLLLMQKQIIPELVKTKEKILEELERLRNQIVSEVDDIIDNFDANATQQLHGLIVESERHTEKTNSLKVRCQKSTEMVGTLNEYGHPVQKVISQTKIAEEYYKLEKDIMGEEQEIELLEFGFDGIERLERIHAELIGSKDDEINVFKDDYDFVRYEVVVSDMGTRKVVRTNALSIPHMTSCYPLYTGITVIDDKHLLLCDNCGGTFCGHIVLLDIESNTVTKLNMNTPFSAAVLKCNPSQVAVSVPNDKEIHIVIIKGDTLTLENTFKCEKQPYSLISLNNGHVGVTWGSPPSFDIVDMSGNEMKTVTSFTQDSTGRQFKSFRYVAVDELRSHIVQSCHVDCTVYCLDFSGNPVFEYNDPELRTPCGIDTDRDGNIYICSDSNYSLHVLTPSGRQIKVVKDMPPWPRAIIFDETGERFWLTASDWRYGGNCDKAFSFSLEV